MQEFTTIFLALVFETAPFLLAGVLISVLGGPLLERALERTALRQPALGMAAGASAGLLLPMCDCGSRPLAHRLALAGRRDFALAFMAAAPVVNPIVIVTTWLAFRDLELLGLRLGITVIIAVLIALVVGRIRDEIALPGAAGHDHEHGAGGFGQRVLSEFFSLFGFLVAGAALASAIQVYLDESTFTSTQGVLLPIVALMALAFLLSICSSVDAFVVAGFGALGTGPLLGFLVFGPIVNLKSMPLYLRLFSVATVVAVVVITAQIAFVAAVIAEYRDW